MGISTKLTAGPLAFFAIFFVLLIVAANAAQQKVDICHIPPGNPENAHFITVGASAVPAHVENHGDEVLSGDDTCTAGMGECAVDGLFACTADGLVCDAEPAEPLEEAEVTCDDGRDNDCDGLIDSTDPDCQQFGVCGDLPCAAEVEAALANACESTDALQCTTDDDGNAAGACANCTVVVTSATCEVEVNCLSPSPQ